jgi:hypothetical protein
MPVNGRAECGQIKKAFENQLRSAALFPQRAFSARNCCDFYSMDKSMWIPILVIALAVALAIGPVMWLRTTPMQRRLISFRNRAAQLGLRVQLRQAVDLDLKGDEFSGEILAGYGLLWVKSPEDDARVLRHPVTRPWRLRRQRISHESHFAGWWDWHTGMEADSAWHEPLHGLIPDLPPDALVVENDRQGLWIYWRERGDLKRVEGLAASLRTLKATGQELARRTPPEEDEEIGP